MYRVGIVGVGNISGKHIAAVNACESSSLVALCDIEIEKARAKADSGVKTFANIDELLEWGEFDCLHICTPHYLHCEMGLKAMRAGKHVLCEKPLAIMTADAEAMINCARENNVRLGVVFQNRYNESSRIIKNLLDTNEMGRLIAEKAMLAWDRDMTYYSQDNWHGVLAKEGGGVVINQAIHTLDLISWFANARVESINASISQKRLKGLVETEDTADALIKFENGVTAVFYATLCYSCNSPVYIELFCENGRIIFNGDILILRNDKEPEYIKIDSATGAKSYWGNSHDVLIKDFYHSLETGEKFPITGEDALAAVKIVNGIYDNAR